MYICVDFDGTCVRHAYPHIGKEIGAVPVLKYLAKKHKIILYTMRDGYTLMAAARWFKLHDIELYGINDNPGAHFTKSPKVHANLYIDDRALGIPLVPDVDRDYVDWHGCVELLHKMHLVEDNDVSELHKQIDQWLHGVGVD